MCNAHGQMADSCDRKYGVVHGNTVEVVIYNKADLRAELEYQNNAHNSRAFNVITLDSGCTKYMFAHKCYFTNLRPAKNVVIRVADGREVPALGVGNIGFLKDCLWAPMLRKDLMSESQLTTKDHLGINREPDSPEAIVYRGSIFGE